MRSTLTIRNAAAAFSGVILIGLALSGSAYAISSAAFRYATPQTGYLMIPASAFVPSSNTVVYSAGNTLSTTGTGCFAGPVNLPHGAKMTRLAIWYGKNDAVPQGVTLERSDDTVIAQVLMHNTGSVPKSAAVEITGLSRQLVNNARFAYSLHFCLHDTGFFTRARITYTYKTAGD